MTKAQKIALKQMLLKEKTSAEIKKRTMDILVREGWYDLGEDKMTQAGLIASDIPTVPQKVFILRRGIDSYHCPILKKELSFPIGTVFYNFTLYEGYGVQAAYLASGRMNRVNFSRIPPLAEQTVIIMPNTARMVEMGWIDE